MDRLDAMQLFVRVAELGSFAGAAQQLGVARSVVTRQIAGLEAHLGVKLMARSTRRLALTSAGTAKPTPAPAAKPVTPAPSASASPAATNSTTTPAPTPAASSSTSTTPTSAS